MKQLLDPLLELLRIPSVSTGEGNPEALVAAANWLSRYVRSASGECSVIKTPRNPLVVGRLDANRPNAPKVLIYGHYDVQGAGPDDLWDSPPFEPTIRDDRLYARGASDNKGNFWPLLFAACEMSRDGALPVEIRVFIEGEEEIGSASAIEWISENAGGSDCAIIFDSGSLDDSLPALTLGARGIVQVKVEVRTGERDVHSGIYGGSVMNALHVLSAMVAPLIPGPDGRVREELRLGIEQIPISERESWPMLAPGSEVLSSCGARPLSPRSGEEYYERNWGDASLDVNWIQGGDPRTVVPSVASAYLSLRLAPGQRHREVGAEIERLLRSAAPDGAEVIIELQGVDAAAFDPESPPLEIARRAIEAATGKEPLLIRMGGTLPILAPLADLGIPTIFSGFAVADDAFHAPNESYRLEALEFGYRTARELYTGLAELER